MLLCELTMSLSSQRFCYCHQNNNNCEINDFFQELKPLFQRLSAPQLLASCSMGLTQNANESLHSVVWSMAPQETYNSPPEVQLAIDIGILSYNTGKQEAVHWLLVAAGLAPPCSEADRMLMALDDRRLETSFQKGRSDTKEKRRQHRNGRLARLTAFRTVEGPMYGSGMFHSRKRSAGGATMSGMRPATQGTPSWILPSRGLRRCRLM